MKLATRVTLYALLCASWAICLWQLDASDLTFDEAATYFVAHRPFLEIISYLRGAAREHPPVYYLLIHPWMRLSGTSVYSLRLFAALCAVLGVALVARLERVIARRTGASASLLSPLTLALLPLGAYYARDARMYTLTIVWALLAAWLFLPLLFDRGRPSRVRLAGLVLVNGLALFTHYYLLLFVLTQPMTLLLARRWRSLMRWSGAHGLVGLTGLSWLLVSPGLSASLAEAWGRFTPTLPALTQVRRLLTELFFGPIKGAPWGLTYLWGGLTALGLLVAWRRARRLGLWLTVALPLPLILAYLMPEPPRTRYLTFLLPFVALALGQLPRLSTRRWAVRLLTLALAALIVWHLGVFGLPRTLTWIKSRYGHTLTTVAAHARPGDRVLFYGPWQWIQYRYYQPAEFPPITALPAHAPPQLDPVEAGPVLRDLLDSAGRLWVLPAAVDDVDPAHFGWRWLNIHAHPVWTPDEFRLYLPPPTHTVARSLDLTLGSGHLRGITADAPPVPAGEALRFSVLWTEPPPTDTLRLDFIFADTQGHRWLQWQQTNSGTPVDRAGLIVPQGAPPGLYTLQVAFLDQATGQALQAADDTGPLPGERVELLTLRVAEPVAPPVLLDDGHARRTFTAPDGSAQLTLIGSELGGLRFQQGHAVPLQLDWLAPPSSIGALDLRLSLNATAVITLPLAPAYPVNTWWPGRLVTLPVAFLLPADAPPGRAQLTLALLGPDGQPWTVAGEERLSLGTLTVEERPLLSQLPPDLQPLKIEFGEQIDLRGYRIAGEARPGGRLELTYAWYARRKPERIYSVFNHLLMPDGQSVAQKDGWPQGGAVLTTQWRSGEYILDHHTLDIPPDAPPGPYLLAVGLYDVTTGERLTPLYNGQPLPNDQWLKTVEPAP